LGLLVRGNRKLEKVLSFAKKYYEKKLINAKTLQDVNVKINRLLTVIDHEPKTKVYCGEETW